MKHTLYEISIETEMDVVLAHRKTTQLCQLAGLSSLEQTRMSTAVSEIARNALEHAKRGRIQFFVAPDAQPTPQLEIAVSDAGAGVDPDVFRATGTSHFLGKGNGISISKKLADHFSLQSSEQGTTVTLQKAIPARVVLNVPLVQQWKTELDTPEKGTQSPYEALKTRNHELIALTQQLEEKNEANRRQVEEIKALNTKLDRKNQELTEFAYTLSHDLKNPLSNILTLTELAKKAESQGVYLVKIETCAFIIRDIIGGLMQIIDIDQEASSSVRLLQFQDIIDRLTVEYSSDIANNQGEIKTDFRVASICYVEAYLSSIARNLVSNAIKYQAERPLQLRLSTAQRDGYVVLSVRDNGIGMDLTRNGDALFQPFRRLTNRKQGKGIGLHLIKKMVEKNGGRIEVESTVGEGDYVSLLFAGV